MGSLNGMNSYQRYFHMSTEGSSIGIVFMMCQCSSLSLVLSFSLHDIVLTEVHHQTMSAR